MSASGEKTARILQLPLKREPRTLQSDPANDDTIGRVYLGARVVAFLAALLFAFAAWAPWLAITYHFRENTQTFTVDAGTLTQALPVYLLRYSTRPAPVTTNMLYLMALFGGAWAGVSAAGVLLAPLLWLRPHTRAVRLALAAYGLWLVLAAVYTLTLAKLVFFPPTIPPAIPAGRFSPFPQWSPAWGMWLALIALVMGLSAATMLIRFDWSSQRISARSTRSPLMRTRAGWLGIGLLTVGIALWGLGFMAIPWATVNCPITPITVNHFVAGQCAALDSGDALSYFATRALSREAWNLAGGIYPLYGMLVGGGLFVLIALWRTSPSRAICAWATLWLLSASAVAYLAYRGVGVILTINPVMSGEARGIWVGASGVTTTLLGLLFAWLGIIPLERAATLTAPPAAAIPHSSASTNEPLHLLTSESNDDGFEVTSLR